MSHAAKQLWAFWASWGPDLARKFAETKYLKNGKNLVYHRKFQRIGHKYHRNSTRQRSEGRCHSKTPSCVWVLKIFLISHAFKKRGMENHPLLYYSSKFQQAKIAGVRILCAESRRCHQPMEKFACLPVIQISEKAHDAKGWKFRPLQEIRRAVSRWQTHRVQEEAFSCPIITGQTLASWTNCGKLLKTNIWVIMASKTRIWRKAPTLIPPDWSSIGIWSSSVTVVLVGSQTGASEWVDWEIWYSLRRIEAFGPAWRVFNPGEGCLIFAGGPTPCSRTIAGKSRFRLCGKIGLEGCRHGLLSKFRKGLRKQEKRTPQKKWFQAQDLSRRVFLSHQPWWVTSVHFFWMKSKSKFWKLKERD